MRGAKSSVLRLCRSCLRSPAPLWQMGNTLKQNWEEPCLFWDCRLLSNMKRDNYFHCGKCGISEWAVPSTSPLFCLSLRKVSFLFAAQPWIKWAEKNSNTNICKLSGFPEQSRSRWQSAGCSILVPVHCPFFGSWVPQEASQGVQPGCRAAPTAGGQQWENPLSGQDERDRAFWAVSLT